MSVTAVLSDSEAAVKAKLKDLESQLAALAVENDALRSKTSSEAQAESDTVQRLRQELAEERELRARGCAGAAATEAVATTTAGQGWSGGRIPRVLARLRRRNTMANVPGSATAAASASSETADTNGTACLSRNSSVAEGLLLVETSSGVNGEECAVADKPDKLTVGPTKAAPDSRSYPGRAVNWVASGLFSLVEDMQAPTEAEKLAASGGEDQLSARRLKVNCSRFGRNTQPIFAFIDGFVKVIRWRSPSYTVLVVLVYYIALLNNYLLPLVLLLCIIRLLINYLKYRLNWDIKFNLIADYEDSESEDASEKERTVVPQQVNFVVHVAKKVQNLTGKISDNLEKFKNLVTWRSPQHTQTLLAALLIAFLLSLVVPTATYMFCVGFYLGLKFFIIDAIFAKYPRLRRKYDSVDKIWRSLPTDQQVGYHQTNKDVEKYILPYSDDELVCSGESRADRSPLGSDDEEFCQTFALPNMECPLARWKGGKRCTIICKDADKTLPDSLKHGKIFLTRSFLCFERSKDRGKTKKRNIVIPLTMIRSVRKTKPFAWLPGVGTAIEVQIRGMEKALSFGAIIGRDELYDSMVETGLRACLTWATAAAAAEGGGTSTTTAAQHQGNVGAVADATSGDLPPDPDLIQTVNQALISDSDTDD